MKKYITLLFNKKVNIFKTIYINFRMLPFGIARKLPIYVFGRWEFAELNGDFVINAPVKRGMISIGINIAGYVTTPKGSLRMRKGSKIIFNDKIFISQGCQIFINDNAVLEMHDDVKLGDSVKLICYKHISIGRMSEITWESQVTDFNSHFVQDLNTHEITNITQPVHIGSHNWIGNRTTVLPGTNLPDRIIVASNSILNKDYTALGIKPYSMIGGMPAKLLRSNVRRIYSHENEKIIFNFFSENNISKVSDEITLEQEIY